MLVPSGEACNWRLVVILDAAARAGVIGIGGEIEVAGLEDGRRTLFVAPTT